ncbi:MAG TPA: hypothetical protein VFM18_17070 [Methanosarcina sp.]|nr:hypothetical protein [Methanosarcina sp.]
MVRGLVFMLIVWAAVTAGVYGFGHLSNSEKVSVVRSATFGLVTAALAGAIVAGMVIVF